MPPSRPTPRSRRRFLTRAAVLGATAMLAGPRALAATDRSFTVKPLGPRSYDLGIPSAALRGQSAPVRIILPTAFAARPTSTWPVLYLLHGAHDDYTAWTRETDIESFTKDQGLIVAMPDAGPTGIPSRWRDGTDYERFQIEEVQAVLEKQYRASDRRAVAGVSTGGYGAMAHTARNPGTFRAAASYSGILDTTLPGVPTLIDTIVARENLDRWSLWGRPVLDFGTWRDFNPQAQANGLRGTALYVSSGGGIAGGGGRIGNELLPEVLESVLWPSAQAFAGTLRTLGIPATEHFYPGGGHEWSYWQHEFAKSWPLLAQGLGLSA
jgi:diacylglycerol O-acyltransferase / trehalose O-mycolyltransferase / mycolyltransferase Ag85